MTPRRSCLRSVLEDGAALAAGTSAAVAAGPSCGGAAEPSADRNAGGAEPSGKPLRCHTGQGHTCGASSSPDASWSGARVQACFATVIVLLAYAASIGPLIKSLRQRSVINRVSPTCPWRSTYGPWRLFLSTLTQNSAYV